MGVVQRWSFMFRPTALFSLMTGIPWDLSSSAGPIPLSNKVCGVLTAPPERITSCRAWTWKRSPPWEVWNSTPIALGVLSVIWSNKMRVARAWHATWRFGRARTCGVRKAVAIDERWPFWSIKVWNRVTPIVPWWVFISGVAGILASSQAGKKPCSTISESHE